MAVQMPEMLQIGGALLGLMGTFAVANTYANVPLRQKPRILLSSIFGGATARSVASEFKLTVETQTRVLRSIRGLALIAVGCILQMVGTLFAALR